MVDKAKKNRRAWRYVLVVSLALNVAIVGMVAGVMLRDRAFGHAPRGYEMSLGPLGQALSPNDRRAIGRALRNDPNLRPFEKDSLRRNVQDFVMALKAQPYSEADLRAVIDQTRSRVGGVEAAATSALVARISEMTGAERNAFADRLAEAGVRRR